MILRCTVWAWVWLYLCVRVRTAPASVQELAKLLPREQVALQARMDISNIEKRFNGSLIFNLGLPKSGTKSVHDFFLCRNFVHSSHFVCAHDARKNTYLHCGSCIEDAAKRNVSLEATCGYHSVYNQMDVEAVDVCSFPQMTHLRFLLEQHPRGKFILLDRDPQSWLASVLNWENHMELRLLRCFLLLGQHPLPPGMTAVPQLVDKQEEWLDLYSRHDGGRILTNIYKEHSRSIVQEFKRHSKIDFLYVHLTDCELEQKLTRFLRLGPPPGNQSCLTHAHKTQTTSRPPCEYFK